MVPLLVCGTDRNATAKKEMVVSGMQEEVRQRVMTMSCVLRSCLGGSRPFWCPQYGDTRVFEVPVYAGVEEPGRITLLWGFHTTSLDTGPTTVVDP